MKRLYYFVLIIIFSHPGTSIAQGWEKMIDEASSSTLLAHILADNEDNFYFLREYLDTFYLSKKQKNGETIWTSSFYGKNWVGQDYYSTIDKGFSLITRSWDPNNKYVILSVKLDSNGIFQKRDTISFSDYDQTFLNTTKKLESGNILVSASVIKDFDLHYDVYPVLFEINDDSEIIWSKVFNLDGYPHYTIKTPDGGYVFMLQGTETDKFSLIKVDSLYDVVWNIEYSNNDMVPSDIALLYDGNILVCGGSLSGTYSFVQKIDQSGNQLWIRKASMYNFYKLVVNQDSSIVIGGREVIENDFQSIKLSKMNVNGHAVWSRNFRFGYNSGMYMLIPYDNGTLLSGWYRESINLAEYDFYLIKTDANGWTFPFVIEGNVFFDENANCTFDSNDSGINSSIITLIDEGSNYYYSISDSTGYFSVNLDTGDYKLSVFPFSPYWDYCYDTLEINLDSLADSLVQVEEPILISQYCPYLITDIATPFLRRCFSSTIYVNYCNYGTIPADTSFIQITLDTFLNFLNSSIPISNQNGNVLTFDLDTIGIGECGNFTIEVEVDCDAPIGMTHCVEAHIYPDSLCVPTPSWSGGSVEVNGVCVSDTIHFSIKNDGNAPLSPGLEYIVIEDDVILYQGQINQLGIGEVQEVSIANVGATYRLEADQEPNYPGISMPTYIIEGCGQGFTPGFVNQFPMDDANPFIDIDCRENVGSYDPNDKQAFPTGFDNEHFIEQNIDLEYLIRFQNTGTDTAFRVVIRDTLSPFLDVASVRPGTSSHPYEFDISGAGILKFTFEPIYLPDSTANEPASHGFVKYRISQKENVPLGSVIENNAAIYFDFNAPVITNTTWHTVGEDFVPMYVSVNNELNKNISVNVFPNPFSKTAVVELKGINLKGEKTFLLFNSTGQLMQESAFETNRFEINGAELNSGVYYFKINNKEGMVVTGKVVVME